MRLEFSVQIFEKILKYQMSWKSVHWEPSCSLRTNGHTDMTMLIVAFFANALKMRFYWKVLSLKVSMVSCCLGVRSDKVLDSVYSMGFCFKFRLGYRLNSWHIFRRFEVFAAVDEEGGRLLLRDAGTDLQRTRCHKHEGQGEKFFQKFLSSIGRAAESGFGPPGGGGGFRALHKGRTGWKS